MNLLIINRLKKQFNNIEVFKNYLSIIILLTYCYFWISIGKYVEINFNKFLNNGLIYLIIFSACLFILIFKLINNRKLPIFSILLVYPVASSIGYFNNINYHQNFDFLIHFFFTISTLLIFFSILEDHKDKKELFKYFFKISLIFISLVFIIIVFPDFVSRIIKNIHVREINFITLNLFFFDYTYIQNSNGASRIAVLIFIYFFTKFIFKIKKNKEYKKYLFLSILLSIIIFYYQSRLSIIFTAIYVLLWILTFSNKNLYLKIIFFVSIIFAPFIIQNVYNSYLEIRKIDLLQKKIHLETKKQYLEINKPYLEINKPYLGINEPHLEIKKYNKNNNNSFKYSPKKETKEYFSVLKKNRTLNLDLKKTKNLFHATGSFIKCSVTTNNKIFEVIDLYSSGRICGWEILLRDIDKEDIIFGKGFFYDQKFLKDYQKISSNSYINVIYNSGLLGFFPYLFIFIFFICKYQVIYKLYIKSDYYDFLIFNLMLFLLIRSFFEDTFAFVSIDLILFITGSVILTSKLNEIHNNKNLNDL